MCIRDSGKTVLVATPYMDEAERCTRIAFLDRGAIQQSGTPEEIKQLVPGRLVEVCSDAPRSALAAVSELPGISSAHLLGDIVRVLWCGNNDPRGALTVSYTHLDVYKRQDQPRRLQEAVAHPADRHRHRGRHRRPATRRGTRLRRRAARRRLRPCLLYTSRCV